MIRKIWTETMLHDGWDKVQPEIPINPSSISLNLTELEHKLDEDFQILILFSQTNSSSFMANTEDHSDHTSYVESPRFNRFQWCWKFVRFFAINFWTFFLQQKFSCYPRAQFIDFRNEIVGYLSVSRGMMKWYYSMFTV